MNGNLNIHPFPRFNGEALLGNQLISTGSFCLNALENTHNLFSFYLYHKHSVQKSQDFLNDGINKENQYN